jgi:hypothetical protein
MKNIEVDDGTHAKIVFAARIMGCTPSEVVRRIVESWSTEAAADAEVPAADPNVVPVHALYRGQRVEATFDRGARTVTVTSGPHAGTTFSTPSAAASAVVHALNPKRNANTNGWSFWRLTPGGDELKALRRSS